MAGTEIVVNRYLTEMHVAQNVLKFTICEILVLRMPFVVLDVLLAEIDTDSLSMAFLRVAMGSGKPQG